uniref:siderophore-interacting protein n=1 Tax=Pedobacter schmidteae TaxID=2201271 RepID=UPI000EAD49EE|nr:siderophore-interacting protein [Pedobacter schmidteae]
METGRIQLELFVSKKKYLTPHYIRITLTGDGIEAIANTTVGINNKILIPPAGLSKIYFPKYDAEKRQWIELSDEIRPWVRTYTHRGIDLEKKEIWIDFVAHGDEGPASAWAINARPGDVLGVMMKEKKTELYPQADNYILIADATGIPVLGAILEDLPATAKGICIIEVHGKEDEQNLETKANMEFQWLHNDSPQKRSLLPAMLKRLELPEKSRYAYVAAEFSAVKEIREYLRKGKKWQRDELDAFSYWKSGVAEDKSATERRQEMSEE